LPAAFKWRSFGFLQAVSVALLSGLAVGAAVAFGALARGAVVVPWAFSLAAAGVTAVGILWLGYVRPLRRMPSVAPGPEVQLQREEFIALIHKFQASSIPGDPDEIMREVLEAQQAIRKQQAGK
jgi:hypothetical protein